MLQSLAVLMLFQLLGDLLAGATGLPLPGPVCGMLLLLAWLQCRGVVPAGLPAVASGLLDHLGLLFVPAGVSIIGLGALVARDGLASACALAVSIVAGVAVTAICFARDRRPAIEPGSP